MPNTQDMHVEIFSTQADHLNDAHIVPHILVQTFIWMVWVVH